MESDLGKVALVTGAGRGIGREIALKLAAKGVRVVINDLDAAPLAQVLDEIRKLGGEGVSLPGSVTVDEFPDHFVNCALETFGGLDIIVNNAGFTWDSVIQKISDEQWSSIIDVHLTAPFRILRAAQPVIKRLTKAAESDIPCRKIVNVSSISGTAGNAGQANYSAAKAGLIGLTKTLAKEWGRYNVTVNSVAFGLISTRMTSTEVHGGLTTVGSHSVRIGMTDDALAETLKSIPLARAGTTADAAGAACFLCSAESDYVTGQTLICDGGLSL